MVYWAVVLTIWVVSLMATALGGAFLLKSLQGGGFLTPALLLLIGILLNFLVVNFPIEGGGKSMDKQTLKALELMAKTANLAPKAVKEGLEKIIAKYS
ncbi:MAG: hypothetical protein DSZ31_04530 [Gammaproteobacteria bacterium]|nr:MAG: hypothetical protein DSZ31_04530 [Gammaproteobacteria bacterium]